MSEFDEITRKTITEVTGISGKGVSEVRV